MMSLWDALRMNMMISYQELVRTFPKKRNHPHADAIHVAGWVSLFTLHVIWPFLWIWATLYRPERGWGMQNHDSSVMQLQQRIAGLEKQLADIKSSSAE